MEKAKVFVAPCRKCEARNEQFLVKSQNYMDKSRENSAKFVSHPTSSSFARCSHVDRPLTDVLQQGRDTIKTRSSEFRPLDIQLRARAYSCFESSFTNDIVLQEVGNLVGNLKNYYTSMTLRNIYSICDTSILSLCPDHCYSLIRFLISFWRLIIMTFMKFCICSIRYPLNILLLEASSKDAVSLRYCIKRPW